MKADDKPKYVEEARQILASIDLDYLISNSNDLKEIRKINRLVAIFTNFSSNDGQELNRLFHEFQSWARRSTSAGTIKNRAADVLQFIDVKIEEMDLYIIYDPIEKNKSQNSTKKMTIKTENRSRRQILDRDLKLLWGRAGNRCSICRDELAAEKTESDPHVIIGIHAHIVADSVNGPRGNFVLPMDKRHLYDNLILLCMKHSKIIDEQLSKYTIEELHRIKNEHEAWVSERLSPPEKVIGQQGNPVAQRDIPVLDLEWTGPSGGPNGHFAQFKITNMSQTQRAMDCQWEVRGFNYSFRSPDSDRFSLQPNFSKEVVFRIDSERLFNEKIPELSLVMEYKDINGNTYFTRRELKQVKVPSDAFYQLERDGIFYPVEQIIDIGIKSISEPYSTGDNEKCDFEITSGGQTQMVTIGVSRTFLSTWDVGNDKEKVRSALAELGSRVIKKMLSSAKLKDYMFVTQNFPQEYQNGFAGYKLLRDSL